MTKPFLTAALLLLVQWLASPAAAEEKIDVTLMDYANNGAYTAEVKIHGIRPDGSKFKVSTMHKVLGGIDTFTVPLNYYLTDRELGSEVWLVLDIMFGETKSCRKDDVKYYYQKGSSNRPRFATAGQTLTNNRCRIAKPK